MTFEEWFDDRVMSGMGRRDLARAVWSAATKVEREECAKIAEQHEEGTGGAEAIRMRSNAKVSE